MTIERGIKVSEIFHFAGGPFNDAIENARLSGRDSEARSYFSFASFEDPDGNGYLLQVIKTRLPGREWKSTADVATLAELLHETEQHHGNYERTHGTHNWRDWYAPYLSAASKREQSGGSGGRRRSLYDAPIMNRW